MLSITVSRKSTRFEKYMARLWIKCFSLNSISFFIEEVVAITPWFTMKIWRYNKKLLLRIQIL